MGDVSEQIRRRAQRLSYESIAGLSGVRSAAWWNDMANYGAERPPAAELFPGIARALDVSERRVAELVAEQWHGVRPDDEIPEHLRELVKILRRIDRRDVPLVEQLARALSDKHTAEILVGSFAPKEEPAG
jgi:transcriptional regulator with XRE-family HTH domain